MAKIYENVSVNIIIIFFKLFWLRIYLVAQDDGDILPDIVALDLWDEHWIHIILFNKPLIRHHLNDAAMSSLSSLVSLKIISRITKRYLHLYLSTSTSPTTYTSTSHYATTLKGNTDYNNQAYWEVSNSEH